jgi:hypothetical protein
MSNEIKIIGMSASDDIKAYHIYFTVFNSILKYTNYFALKYKYRIKIKYFAHSIPKCQIVSMTKCLKFKKKENRDEKYMDLLRFLAKEIGKK